MNNTRTVSDTKRDFYSYHARPINSIYRRIVEELMVEMHLLAVNSDFRYDPIYALGVVTSFYKFMQGYRPPEDKDSIFQALCRAVGGDPSKYQQDAQRLTDLAKRLAGKELMAWLSANAAPGEEEELRLQIEAIAQNPRFKYSRLFAIGLFSFLEQADSDLVADEKQRQQALQPICQFLHLPEEKLQKDLELYLSNLDKVAQARAVIADAIAADRKKQQERAADKNANVS